ncbi:hypothetical protein M408DRAFT_19051 [Serendipita vermifera MAFF 305830]|uniref:BRCT domain-containing protein n=1 Tax=Serendipita vermifera MAFF 305830 TaxID=933852 RepID=A0A0C2X7V2_SERVB|nr:hypothetical protein M408DRAFT_19051 [Serendipita vermifera MAFF 305830]
MSTACFSPQVGKSVRQLWQENGGSIATSVDDLGTGSFFIAAQQDQFWIKSLTAYSITVYAETWVVDSVLQGKLAPSREYELAASLSAQTTPPEPVAANDLGAGDETMTEDGTSSELEVERTLVDEKDEDVISSASGSAVHFQSLQETFRPSSLILKPPEIPISLLIASTPAVLCCQPFRVGGCFDGAPFDAKPKTPK